MSKFSNPIRFNVKKFDGNINFDLWQVQVKNMLQQSELHKALKEKPSIVLNEDSSKDKDSDKSSMSDEDWKDLDLKAASSICLCLTKNVLANVYRISTAKELWEKLEELYQAKSISNRLYLKEQFHTLRMDEGSKISDHLRVFNGIVSKLEAIGVEIEDEDKALRLILSLSSSYEHVKPILMNENESLNFTEVTSKLLFEEKKLKSGSRTSSEDTMLVTRNKSNWKKNNFGKNIICWRCEQSGHVKKNCQGGAGSTKCSKSEASSVSLLIEDDDFL